MAAFAFQQQVSVCDAQMRVHAPDLSRFVAIHQVHHETGERHADHRSERGEPAVIERRHCAVPPICDESEGATEHESRDAWLGPLPEGATHPDDRLDLEDVRRSSTVLVDACEQ